MTADTWPALPYDEWRATRDTLHMYTQAVGKLRLALAPFEPEWGNVPLYVTARGLTTSPIPVGLRAFDAEFDLLDHVLVIRTSDGAVERVPLGNAVADFYAGVVAALRRMHIDVKVSAMPSEVSDPIPLPEDRTHHTYDAAYVQRFQQVLSIVDTVLKQHRARFRGRTSPVHFFWGTFDLALTRYSLVPHPTEPGAGLIARFGGDAEQICAGWWPGDERTPDSAFFAYGYPAPPGVEHIAVEPDGAAWSETRGEFLLPYDKARAAVDPRQAVLAFCDSTYRGLSARMRGWDPAWTDFPTPDAESLDATRRST